MPNEDVDALLSLSGDIRTAGSAILTARASLSASDQPGWGYELLSLVTGMAPAAGGAASPGFLHSLTLQLDKLGDSSDVEDEAVQVMGAASDDAYGDLAEALQEMQATRSQKEAITDQINAINQAMAGVKGHLDHAQRAGERWSVDPYSEDVRRLVFVGEGATAAVPVSADQGGDIQVAVNCSTSNTGASVAATLVETSTSRALGSAESARVGSLAFTGSAPAGAPVPVLLKITASPLPAGMIVPCSVRVGYTSRRPKTSRPLDPAKARAIAEQVAQLKSAAADFSTTMGRALGSQPSAEDAKFLRGFVVRIPRALNKLSILLAAGELSEIDDRIDDSKDALSEMSQEDQLVLQQLMERKSQFESMFSNLMKTFQQTSDGVVSNLK